MMEGLTNGTLMRLLILALHKVPDHSVTLDEASWAEAAAYAAANPGSGFMLTNHDGKVVAKLADHEDRVVLVDRARAKGYTIIDSPDVVIGLGPEE